jgi:hypothetical protein
MAEAGTLTPPDFQSFLMEIHRILLTPFWVFLIFPLPLLGFDHFQSSRGLMNDSTAG